MLPQQRHRPGVIGQVAKPMDVFDVRSEIIAAAHMHDHCLAAADKIEPAACRFIEIRKRQTNGCVYRLTAISKIFVSLPVAAEIAILSLVKDLRFVDKMLPRAHQSECAECGFERQLIKQRIPERAPYADLQLIEIEFRNLAHE